MEKLDDPKARSRAGENPISGVPSNRRLAVGVALIALALGALAAAEYFRTRPAPAAPPHEPSQALIAPPVAEPAPADVPKSDRSGDLPPPPEVINNETLRPPARSAAPVSRQAVAKPMAPLGPDTLPVKGYTVQLGVFSSPANAEALRARLVREGIDARTETRVQLGPFRSRKQAQEALANARNLGVDAVLVPPR